MKEETTDFVEIICIKTPLHVLFVQWESPLPTFKEDFLSRR